MISNCYRPALNGGLSSREKGVRPSVCQTHGLDCDKTEDKSVQIFISKLVLTVEHLKYKEILIQLQLRDVREGT